MVVRCLCQTGNGSISTQEVLYNVSHYETNDTFCCSGACAGDHVGPNQQGHEDRRGGMTLIHMATQQPARVEATQESLTPKDWERLRQVHRRAR